MNFQFRVGGELDAVMSGTFSEVVSLRTYDYR